MKKIILSLISFLLVTLIPGFFYVNAGSPLPGECGFLDSPCCYYEVGNTLSGPPQTGSSDVDAMANSYSTVLENILEPVVNPLGKTVQEVTSPCIIGTPSTPGNPADPSCKCVQPTVVPLAANLELCNAIKKPAEISICSSCLQAGGVWTGIGCIYANTSDFIQKTLLGWGIGLAGGLALLCIIYAAFQMQSSQGNPEKLKKAQEMITSCIMGLMLIIFSVFILRLIGVNILRIPGFI